MNHLKIELHILIKAHLEGLEIKILWIIDQKSNLTIINWMAEEIENKKEEIKNRIILTLAKNNFSQNINQPKQPLLDNTLMKTQMETINWGSQIKEIT